MKQNGSNVLHISDDHDTLPPGCPSPYLCEGLEKLIIDVGTLRDQMSRIEANQEMQISEMRKMSEILGLFFL